MVMRRPRWTKEEEEKLRQYFPDHSNLEVTRAMNRSFSAVTAKAHVMGLKKDKAHRRRMGLVNIGFRYHKSYVELDAVTGALGLQLHAETVRDPGSIVHPDASADARASQS